MRSLLPSSSTLLMSTVKATRKRLTFDEKLAVLDMLCSGSIDAGIVSTFGVSPRFVRKLKQEAANLRRSATIGKMKRIRKAMSYGQNRALESEVLLFLAHCRQLKFPVSRDIIRQRAIIVRDRMLNDDSVDGNVKAKLARFDASEGWCMRFVKRNDLHSRVLHGQASSADVHGGQEKMMVIRA